MSDLIQSGFDYAVLPSEVALKAQLAANSIKLRLKRTVEDIIEIGRELTAVKADLPHGQFLPWIAAEFEMSRQTADNFEAVYKRFGDGKLLNFSNLKPSILYALAAPSTPETVVEKAIEKAESGEKVTVADVKDWKSELDAEKKAREEAEKRNEEWKTQWITERDDKRKLEKEVETLKKQSVEVKEVEKIPDDYEATKQKAESLQKTLDELKKEQDRIIKDQVIAKLNERQQELNKLERDKQDLESVIERHRANLESLSSEVRRIEAHRGVIENQRLHLVDLASFISSVDSIDDEETREMWLRLSGMLRDGSNAILSYLGIATGDNAMERFNE